MYRKIETYSDFPTSIKLGAGFACGSASFFYADPDPERHQNDAGSTHCKKVYQATR
jgi:hypothetical protein